MNLIIRSYVHSYENGNQFFMVGLRRKIESPPTQLPKGLFYYLFNVYSHFFLAKKQKGFMGHCVGGACSFSFIPKALLELLI